ncbi:hypothetical protein B484DRAFT_482977, partial [Ochromonadaceae sp. CCMP2298]
MITSDQSEQLDFNNRKRAALRSQLSASLLSSLRMASVSVSTDSVGDSGDSVEGGAGAEAEARGGMGTVGTGLGRGTHRPEQTLQYIPEEGDEALGQVGQVGGMGRPTSIAGRGVPVYMNETLSSCMPDTVRSASASASASSMLDSALLNDFNLRTINGGNMGTVGEGTAEGGGAFGQDDPDQLSASYSLDEGQSQSQFQSQSFQMQSAFGNTGTGLLSSMPSTGDRGDGGRGGQSERVRASAVEVSDETSLEIDLTLSRSISYQHGSQGLLHQLPRPLAHTKPTPHDGQQYVGAEAELGREVTLAIELREDALAALLLEAAALKAAYVEDDNDRFSAQAKAKRALTRTRTGLASDLAGGDAGNKARLEPLLGRMRAVRAASLDFAEAFGAWARLLHRQKAEAARRERKKAEQFGASHARLTRTYSVVLAVRSSTELYAQSAAVHASVKKYARGMEAVKYATETQLVGVYGTKDEALLAFDKAYAQIPQEYLLLADVQAVSKKLVGMRNCGRHYWVRSNAVRQDLPCEQCALAAQLEERRREGVPALYPEAVGQFLWRGQNYLEKMWGDLDFLREVEYLRAALPEEEFRANPLLLSNQSVHELLQQMQAKKAGARGAKDPKGVKGATAAGTTGGTAPSSSSRTSTSGGGRGGVHPTDALRGKTELLRDAARAGGAHVQVLREREFALLHRDSPYSALGTRTNLDLKRHTEGEGEGQ